MCPPWVSGATAACAYPVGDAVGRQWVVIPGNSGLAAGAAYQAPVFIFARTTIATFTARDTAFVLAKVTLDSTGVGWRQSSKAKLFAALSVDLLKLVQVLTADFTNAVGTDRQNFGYLVRDFATFSAPGHSLPMLKCTKNFLPTDVCEEASIDFCFSKGTNYVLRYIDTLAKGPSLKRRAK